MKFSRLSILASFLFLITIFAQATVVAPYDYPYRDPLIATMTNAITRPSMVKLKFERLTPMPERNSIPLYEDRAHLTYGYLFQPQAAPLVFLMPGLGGVAHGSAIQFLAEKLYLDGYHVVTLTNPFSWQFSLAASRTGLVGYAPDDTRDLYHVMKLVVAHLQELDPTPITQYGFVGYSLAGLQGAFLAKYDREERFFNFKRFLLINPPFDFIYGLNTLDAFHHEGDILSDDEKQDVLYQVASVFFQKEKEKVDYNYFLGLDHLLQLQPHKLKWVLAASFRDTLSDVIMVSQQIHDLGILKNPATEESISDRLDEIRMFSFEQYMRIFVLPTLPPSQDSKDPIFETDIRSLTEYLKNDTRIYLMHNLDDFLIKPEDQHPIEAIFGNRARLYPLGGHVGNLWFPQNDWDIKMILSPLKE